MKALKRQRRIWSKDEKLAILAEALDTSVSAVARKHGIRTSLVFCWRKELQPNNLSQQKPVADKSVVNAPTLDREYRKLAKIQAALSAKLKRDLDNDAISAYNAGNTLISLYNGIAKLESLRTEIADPSNSGKPSHAGNQSEVVSPEAHGRQREIQRMAERALVEIEKRRTERNRLQQPTVQGQANVG